MRKGRRGRGRVIIWLIALVVGIIVWGWKVVKRRGYSPWIGVALAFFLRWIGIIICYVLPTRQGRRHADGRWSVAVPVGRPATATTGRSDGRTARASGRSAAAPPAAEPPAAAAPVEPPAPPAPPAPPTV